ncbi:MAG: non-heme iron oxygenase ferredoxin subunit [Gammaproteobacteria bacterium]|nr:MAG: non-heme iron oxygenase ferredoxin subunit [Gammaproteobacteria bacterium]
MSDWIHVGRPEEIPAGQYKVVELDDTQVAIVNYRGAFYAIEDICTHDGARLTGLPLEEDQIVCPRHGARFCVRTGKAVTAPAYQDIDCFPVEIRDDGLYIRDNRWD